DLNPRPVQAQLTGPVFNSVDSGEAVGTREHNPQQKSATIGIGPLERPTLVTRFFMRIVGCVEHLNLALSAVGNPPIYDKTIFPWTRSIESEWRNPCRTPARALAKRGIAGLPRASTHRWSTTIAGGRASY